MHSIASKSPHVYRCARRRILDQSPPEVDKLNNNPCVLCVLYHRTLQSSDVFARAASPNVSIAPLPITHNSNSGNSLLRRNHYDTQFVRALPGNTRHHSGFSGNYFHSQGINEYNIWSYESEMSVTRYEFLVCRTVVRKQFHIRDPAVIPNTSLAVITCSAPAPALLLEPTC